MTGSINTNMQTMNAPLVQPTLANATQVVQQPETTIQQPQAEYTQQPAVNAQTFLSQQPNTSTIQQTPVNIPNAYVTEQEPIQTTQQPKTNSLEKIGNFIKSDKCALWTGGIISAAAIIAYALAPKRPPGPGFFERMTNAIKNFKIKLPKITLPKFKLPKFKLPKFKLPKFKLPKITLPKIKIPGVKAFKNFCHNTRKLVF